MAIVKRRYKIRAMLDEAHLKNIVGPSAAILKAAKDYVDIEVDNATDGILDSLDEAMTASGLYYDPAPSVTFHATSRVVGTEKEITSDEWIGVGGGIITNPAFFVTDPNKTFGRISCAVKTVGTGAKLKVVESDIATTTSMLQTPFEFPDTEGEWRIFNIDTDIPPHAEDHEYGIELTRGGATSLFIRSAHITLLELEYLS